MYYECGDNNEHEQLKETLQIGEHQIFVFLKVPVLVNRFYSHDAQFGYSRLPEFTHSQIGMLDTFMIINVIN